MSLIIRSLQLVFGTRLFFCSQYFNDVCCCCIVVVVVHPYSSSLIFVNSAGFVVIFLSARLSFCSSIGMFYFLLSYIYEVVLET